MSADLSGAMLIPGVGPVQADFRATPNLLIPGFGIAQLQVPATASEIAGGTLVWDFNFFMNSP